MGADISLFIDTLKPGWLNDYTHMIISTAQEKHNFPEYDVAAFIKMSGK